MSAGFEKLLRAVVRIDVRELAFEQGAKRFRSGVGSGVILSEDGLVVTNAHVVTERAVEISVTLANLEQVRATFVGWDHWTDLALIRLDMDEVERRGLAFTHARFGDSDRLYPGQTVYAAGTPHGLARTVSRGIISNTNRYFEDTSAVRGYETGAFNTWLQTDAAINPGNSGGPLVTEDGRIVGINSRAYVGADNLGFAIPANVVREVVTGLAESGEIVRSTIGIVPRELQDLESFYKLEINTGMLIERVDPGSPAAKAGVQAGDILLSVDGEPVDGRFPEQLPPILHAISSVPVGSTVNLQLRRDDSAFGLTVVTERLESRVGEEWAFERWGLSVQKVSRAFSRERQLPDDTGVLVIGTQRGFPADEAGLSRGDIVIRVNDTSLENLDALKRIYDESAQAGEPLLFETLRGRRVSYYILKP